MHYPISSRYSAAELGRRKWFFIVTDAGEANSVTHPFLIGKGQFVQMPFSIKGKEEMVAVVVGFVEITFVMAGDFEDLHHIQEATDVVANDGAVGIVDPFDVGVVVARFLPVRTGNVGNEGAGAVDIDRTGVAVDVSAADGRMGEVC